MIETQDNPIVPRGLRVPPASRPNYCVPLLRINEITTRNLVYGRSNSYPRPWNVLPFLPTIFFLFSLLSSSDSFRHSFFISLDSCFSDDRNRRRQCVDIVLRKSGEIIFSMVNLIRLCTIRGRLFLKVKDVELCSYRGIKNFLKWKIREKNREVDPEKCI